VDVESDLIGHCPLVLPRTESKPAFCTTVAIMVHGALCIVVL
jgi:hypothetical protein